MEYDPGRPVTPEAFEAIHPVQHVLDLSWRQQPGIGRAPDALGQVADFRQICLTHGLNPDLGRRRIHHGARRSSIRLVLAIPSSSNSALKKRSVRIGFSPSMG